MQNHLSQTPIGFTALGGKRGGTSPPFPTAFGGFGALCLSYEVPPPLFSLFKPAESCSSSQGVITPNFFPPDNLFQSDSVLNTGIFIHLSPPFPFSIPKMLSVRPLDAPFSHSSNDTAPLSGKVDESKHQQTPSLND